MTLKKQAKVFLVLGGLVLFGLACTSKNIPTAPTAPQSATATPTPFLLKAVWDDNTTLVSVILPSGTGVVLPAGSLSQPSTVLVSDEPFSDAPPLPPGFQVVGDAIYFQVIPGPLAGSVTLTFPYQPSQIPTGLTISQVEVLYYNGSAWVAAPNQYLDPVNHLFVVVTNHFSPWCLAGNSSSTITPVPTGQSSFTPIPSSTPTQTPTPTNTFLPGTFTPTQVFTNTSTPTSTSTVTSTHTLSPTVTLTPTSSGTPTWTGTPTATGTPIIQPSVLNTGDIAFIYINSGGSGSAQYEGFVTFQPILNGTTIQFTDQSYSPGTGLSTAGRHSFTWQASSDLSAGTTIGGTSVNCALAGKGDFCIAYQLNNGVTTYLAAVGGVGSAPVSTGWTIGGTVPSASPYDSYLPPNLDATNTVWLPNPSPSTTNAAYQVWYYDCADQTDSEVGLREAIATPANWNQTPSSCTFTMGSAPTQTFTATNSFSPTVTDTTTVTSTITDTPTITNTPALSFTFTNTPTITLSPTVTSTPTNTSTVTSSLTSTVTSTATLSPTFTVTSTPMPNLTPGAIAFTGFVQNGNTQISFVPVGGSLPASQVIYFTTYSYNGSSLVDESVTVSSTATTVLEGITSYTAPATGLGAFNQVIIGNSGTNQLFGGSIANVAGTSGKNYLVLNHNGAGHKVLAYTVSGPTTQYIAALLFGPDTWQNSGAVTAFWDSYLPSSLSSANSTDLSGLWTVGNFSQWNTSSGQNQCAVCSCQNSLNGIVNPYNWSGNGAISKNAFNLSPMVSVSSCGAGNGGYNVSLLPTVTGTEIPNATPNITSTFTATPDPSDTPTVTDTDSPTVTPDPTDSPTVTSTLTTTNTPTVTSTSTWSGTPTQTSLYTSTITDTPTITMTPTVTSDPSDTPTVTSTSTPTNTSTATSTFTQTATLTTTNTVTGTFTATVTSTITVTNTPMPNLTPGAIAFTGFVQNGNTQISFVPVGGSLPASQVIYFTTYSYNGIGLVDESVTVAATATTVLEGITSYTAPATGLGAFNQVIMGNSGTNQLFGGSIANVAGTSGKNYLVLNHNGAGHKVLAYTVSGPVTQYIAALLFGPDTWQTSGAVTAFWDSYLPSSLSTANSTDLSTLWTVGNFSQWNTSTGQNQNAVANCQSILSGIVNPYNWTGNGGISKNAFDLSPMVSVAACGAGNGGYNVSLLPTVTGTEIPNLTPTNTPGNTSTFTATPDPSDTPTFTATSDPSDTPTVTSTFTTTNTPTVTSTETFTVSDTATASSTSTPTITDTPTMTLTVTETFTSTWTDTPTVTDTVTQTSVFTSTITDTPTSSFTPTITPDPTDTSTSTETDTNTPTITATETPTVTATFTATTDPSDTPTVTPTWTSTNTLTLTQTTTNTPTSTATNTRTNTSTATPSSTATSTKTFTPSPTPTGTNQLAVSLIYNGSKWTSGKSVLGVGLFNSSTFSQSALLATAKTSAFSTAPPWNKAVTFFVNNGTYYVSAIDNVNGTGSYFDKTTYAYPIDGCPYNTFSNLVNNGVYTSGVSFSWPYASGNTATPIVVSGNSTVTITFNDTYVVPGLNGQPNYTGSLVTLGTSPAGIYAVAYTSNTIAYTNRTPANDWGYNPSNSTNVNIATHEDEALGTPLYVQIFADSGNAMTNTSPCGNLAPCIQNGDPYTIVGPLNTDNNTVPGSGQMTVTFGDGTLSTGGN